MQYMDPGAAAHALSELAHAEYLMTRRLARLSNRAVCELAADMAYTYVTGVGGTPAEAIEWYHEEGFTAHIRDLAIGDLTRQSLYGDNGSPAWLVYSMATRWVSDTTGPLSEREVAETVQADAYLRDFAEGSEMTLTEAHRQSVRRHMADPDTDSIRWVRALDRALIGALALDGCPHTNRSEVGITNTCDHGCKIHRCDRCGALTTQHSPVYGCRTPVTT